MDLMTGPLEPWVDADLVLNSYHQAVKRMLKVEVVEGLFTKEMRYSGMTMSTLEDQMKVVCYDHALLIIPLKER